MSGTVNSLWTTVLNKRQCDARAPCGHCARRVETCSNVSLPDEVCLDQPAPSAITQSSGLSLDLTGPSSTATQTTLLGISRDELHLLNHYCNFVAPRISAHDNLARVWQYEVPHQAKTHSFLMHNILSTSAYHLCCAYAGPFSSKQEKSKARSSIYEQSVITSPFTHVLPGHTDWQIRQSNRYEHFALQQQHLAFQSFIPSLYNLSMHNQEALCAASALFSLNALASTQKRCCLPDFLSYNSSPIDAWLEISILVRGVDAIIQTADPSIMDGPLQPLLRHHRVEGEGEGNGRDVEDQVRNLVSSSVLSALDVLAPEIDHRVSSNADRIILHAALGLLRTSFAIVAVNPEHESIVMVWSNLLEAEFFPFVKRREPMALVLLAYWTVLLKTFRDRWWVGGLSTTILKDVVRRLIPLDERSEDTRDGYVQRKGPAKSRYSLGSCPDGSSDLTPGNPTWEDLLEWPLHENGVCGV